MRQIANRYWGHGAGAALGLLMAVLIAVTATRHDFAHATPTHMGHPMPAHAAPVVAAIVTAPQTFEPITPEQAVAVNARVPASTAPLARLKPFSLDGAGTSDRARALHCLTAAVYYEAGNQGPDGEAAVAQVVLNRVRNPIFPKTVCGVVFQGSELHTGCQFTFTCDGSLARKPYPPLWKAAEEVAERALDGHVETSVGSATHYHTIWVVPYWQSSVVKIRQIGAHIFYRMAGEIGGAQAFNGHYAGGESAPDEALAEEAEAAIAAAGPVSAPNAAPALASEPVATIAAEPARPVEVAVQTARSPTDPIPTRLVPPRPDTLFGGRAAEAPRLALPGRF